MAGGELGGVLMRGMAGRLECRAIEGGPGGVVGKATAHLLKYTKYM